MKRKRQTMKGKVYLVGAGPGDPGLLTLKGRDALVHADAVLYDSLVNSKIVGLAKKSRVEKFFVGKIAGQCHPKQSAINCLMERLAGRHRVVVRLKGGDPFLLARGGEEAMFLRRRGIPFEVVPGVTSALAVPAYAGIPLTERHTSSVVTIVSGHPGKNTRRTKHPPIDWMKIPRGSTLVVLMGLAELRHIAERLLTARWDPQTPVAVTQSGTLPTQVTVEGTLRNIAGRVEKAKITSPAVIVVGQVARLRRKMRWFNDGEKIQ